MPPSIPIAPQVTTATDQTFTILIIAKPFSGVETYLERVVNGIWIDTGDPYEYCPPPVRPTYISKPIDVPGGFHISFDFMYVLFCITCLNCST